MESSPPPGRTRAHVLTPCFRIPSQLSLSGSSFDTLLGVYTGAAVNSLTLVASNDDCGAETHSCRTFGVSAGVLYYIQVWALR